MIYLESKNPDENRFRFYSLTVERSLFSGLVLTRQWGRIGSRRSQFVSQEFSDLDELISYVHMILMRRQRRQYTVIERELRIPHMNGSNAHEIMLTLKSTNSSSKKLQLEQINI